MGKMRAFSTTLAPERRQSWQVIESRCAGSGLARSCCPPGVVGSGCRSVTRCRSSSSSISLRGRLSRSTPSPCRSSNKPRQQRFHAQRDRRTQPTSRRCHSVVGGYTRHVDGCAPGPCAAAAASSRYGKRLLTDPDDRLGDPLFGEPAADFGKELSSRPGRRRPLVVEVPAIVALPADAAAVAPQPLGEQDRAHPVRRPASDIS